MKLYFLFRVSLLSTTKDICRKEMMKPVSASTEQNAVNKLLRYFDFNHEGWKVEEIENCTIS